MPLGRELGLGQHDIVLDGDPVPPPAKPDRTPNFWLVSIFGSCLLWPNGWMDQRGTWHGGRPRPRPHCARWGPSSLPEKGEQPSQFSAHVYCGQTAGWIEMPLGIKKVGLEPGNIVLDMDQPPPQKGAQPVTFRPMYVVAKRLDGSRCRLVRR